VKLDGSPESNGGFNLGLLMRHLIGIGTPRGLQDRLTPVLAALLVLLGATRRGWSRIFRMASTDGGCTLVSAVTDHHQPLLGGVTTYTTGC
jgi:hypothetical protein